MSENNSIFELLLRSSSSGPVISAPGCDIYLPDDPRFSGYLIKSAGKNGHSAINAMKQLDTEARANTKLYIDRNALGGNSGQTVFFTANNDISVVVNAGKPIDSVYGAEKRHLMEDGTHVKDAANTAFEATLDKLRNMAFQSFRQLVDSVRHNMAHGMAFDGRGANLAIAGDHLNIFDTTPIISGYGVRRNLDPEIEQLGHASTDFVPLRDLKFVDPKNYGRPIREIMGKLRAAASDSLKENSLVVIQPKSTIDQKGIITLATSTDTLNKWRVLLEELRGVTPER